MSSLPKLVHPSALCLQNGWAGHLMSARDMTRRAVAPWLGCAQALTCSGLQIACGVTCMSGKCFVDTDILIYAHDRSAGAKHMRAQMLLEKLWDCGWGIVSTQVLEELCTQLCSNVSHPLSVEEASLLIRDYCSWEVVARTPASVLDALEIVTRLKIPFLDALILEAAERSGASVIYSEHLATVPRYGAIQIVNPLAEPVTP